MGWTAVSDGAGKGSNEDLVAVHERDGVTDVLVLDGATSVAERDYADRAIGDVAWFVRRFAHEAECLLGAHEDVAAVVDGAVRRTRAAYLERIAGQAVPDHAWPIAALTWTRIRQRAGHEEIELFCLGDCKALLRAPDGSVRDLDPWVNPQEGVVKAALAALRAEGVLDPVERHARMLPLLRARREQQNAAAAPDVLCLRPAGGFTARRAALRAPPGASLLGMTDGFYRLADPYGLYADAGLAHACLERGLAAMLAELRAAEAVGGIGDMPLKAADDASAVLWTR